MRRVSLPIAVEPDEWTVVFHRNIEGWWFRAIAMGHFKHVSAFAYLSGMHGWAIFDWQHGGIRPAYLPHSEEACRLIDSLYGGPDNEWVVMRRQPGPASLTGFRFGTCVGAVKHLLGIRSWALRPDALYRHCRRLADALPADAGQRNSAHHDRIANSAISAASGRPEVSAAQGAG